MIKTLLNFSPISILNCFSKVYENILKTQFVEKMNNLDKLCVERIVQYAAYLNNTSEEWRKNSDNNNFIGPVLMILSKAFDCIPHDFVIAKLAAYGFDKNMICHIYSHLKK